MARMMDEGGIFLTVLRERSFFSCIKLALLCQGKMWLSMKQESPSFRTPMANPELPRSSLVGALVGVRLTLQPQTRRWA